MPELKDLLPAGIFLGTSLILRQDGRYLYGLRPARSAGGQAVVELTGIGGKLEATDASLRAGLLREAEEEIGGGVRLLPAARTLVVRGRDDVTPVGLTGAERPAALVFRGHRTPPHEPWSADNRGQGCLVVFLGELTRPPRLVAPDELPHLIWLTPAQVVTAARRDVSLPELQAGGAELIGAALPADAQLRLTDSQEALALAAPDFFLAT